MEDENVILEMKQPEFDKSRFRVYYGNIGEIVAQEVLSRQGFEAWLTRPIANERDFLRLLRFPKIRLDELRRNYEIHPSFWKEKMTWEQYLKEHRERLVYERKTVKRYRAFFGGQKTAFRRYIRRLEKESITYIADLLAKKANQIFIIEVKSTKGALKFLKGEKLKGLMLAREYGFTPAIISFDLKIEATNFKMMEIR